MGINLFTRRGQASTVRKNLKLASHLPKGDNFGKVNYLWTTDQAKLNFCKNKQSRWRELTANNCTKHHFNANNLVVFCMPDGDNVWGYKRIIIDRLTDVYNFRPSRMHSATLLEEWCAFVCVVLFYVSSFGLFIEKSIVTDLLNNNFITSVTS